MIVNAVRDSEKKNDGVIKGKIKESISKINAWNFEPSESIKTKIFVKLVFIIQY
jgi:hypothetical protein